MVDVDTILRDGAARREREANRRKLLDELHSGTRRSKTTALLCFSIAGFYFWRLREWFMSDIPMVRMDALELLSYCLICVMMFSTATNSLRVSRRDLFLIELLEEKMENEKRA